MDFPFRALVASPQSRKTDLFFAGRVSGGRCEVLAALARLFMIAIIQITVPEGWAIFHLPWVAMALVVFGGGRIGLDGLLREGEGGTAKAALMLSKNLRLNSFN